MRKTEHVSPLPPIDFLPFQLGEKLTYTLKYSFITAGHASFEVKNENALINGKEHFHIAITGQSNSFFDNLYKVRDYYDSYLDRQTMMPAIFSRDIYENGYKLKEKYTFDRIGNRVIVNDKAYQVPAQMLDIISAFYYVRCIDFSKQKPGAEINMNTWFENANFPVGVKYIGKSIIKTKIGKVKCLVFKPKLIKGRVFKNQDDMTLYVSDDKNQIPLKIESAVYLDYVHADLESFSGLRYPITCKVKD